MKRITYHTPTIKDVTDLLTKPHKEVSCAIWTVTPEIAEHLIVADPNINAGNRDAKKSEITALARDMAENIWHLTGDSIKFGFNGTLLDGQHRLKACMLAGVSFTTLVLSGLDPAFYTTMDTGKGKTAADIFKKAHVKYHGICASATQHLRRWTSASPITDRSTDKPHVLLDLYLSNWPFLHESAGNSDVLRLKRDMKHPHATLTALHALFSSVDKVAADTFFEAWAETEHNPVGGKRTPVRMLQRALYERNANLAVIGGRMDDRDRVLMVVKAWRAHAFGDRLVAEDLKTVSARSGTPWPGVEADYGTSGVAAQ